MPRTSIIIPEGPGAPGTVASVLDQCDADFELLVVCAAGGSRCGVHAGKDPRIRVITSPAASLARRVNHALAESRAPFVKILPAGQCLAPTCVEVQRAALEVRPDLAVVFARVEPIDATGRPAPGGASYETAARTGEEIFPLLLGKLRLAPAAALIRRPAFEAVRGLDPRYVRAPFDDLWLRLLGEGNALLLGERLARVPVFDEDDAIARVERSLARLRALDRLGLERFLLCLGGGRGSTPEWRGRARLALADILLDAQQDLLLPVVSRLVTDALACGVVLGAARTARLVEAGLTGFADAAPLASPGSAAPRCVPRRRDEASDTPSPALRGLRAQRRRLAELGVEIASERASATALRGIAERAAARIDGAGSCTVSAPAAAPDGEGAVLVAGSERVSSLAERLLERLRLGARLRRAAARVRMRTHGQPRSESSTHSNGGLV